jgi:hypothetical protein
MNVRTFHRHQQLLFDVLHLDQQHADDLACVLLGNLWFMGGRFIDWLID